MQAIIVLQREQPPQKVEAKVARESRTAVMKLFLSAGVGESANRITACYYITRCKEFLLPVIL